VLFEIEEKKLNNSRNYIPKLQLILLWDTKMDFLDWDKQKKQLSV
jgi:hypothetical protein